MPAVKTPPSPSAPQSDLGDRPEHRLRHRDLREIGQDRGDELGKPSLPVFTKFATASSAEVKAPARLSPRSLPTSFGVGGVFRERVTHLLDRGLRGLHAASAACSPAFSSRRRRPAGGLGGLVERGAWRSRGRGCRVEEVPQRVVARDLRMRPRKSPPGAPSAPRDRCSRSAERRPSSVPTRQPSGSPGIFARRPLTRSGRARSAARSPRFTMISRPAIVTFAAPNTAAPIAAAGRSRSPGPSRRPRGGC